MFFIILARRYLTIKVFQSVRPLFIVRPLCVDRFMFKPLRTRWLKPCAHNLARILLERKRMYNILCTGVDSRIICSMRRLRQADVIDRNWIGNDYNTNSATPVLSYRGVSLLELRGRRYNACRYYSTHTRPLRSIVCYSFRPDRRWSIVADR